MSFQPTNQDAPFAPVFFDPQAPLDVENERLRRRQAVAEAQARESMQALNLPQSEGKMVGGRWIRPSAAEGITRGINAIAGQYQRSQAEKAVGQYGAAEKEAAAAHMKAMPRDVAPSEMDPEGGKVTPEQRIAWAQQGQSIPSLRGTLGKLFDDQLINEPTRQEAREFRGQEAEAQRGLRREIAAADAAQRLQIAQQRSEDTRLSIEQRREAAAEAAAARRDVAAMLADSRRDVAAAKSAQLKKLPAAQSRAWTENEVSLTKVDDALAELEKDPNAVGKKGIVPDIVLQRMDPTGVNARAKIADIGSLKIHDRSGAAVTAKEFPRLRPFVPNVTDTPEVAKQKLENFKREYELVQQEILNYAEDQGYTPPVKRERKPGGGGGEPNFGQPVKVTSKADRDALPPGTRYIGPDGKTYTR